MRRPTTLVATPVGEQSPLLVPWQATLDPLIQRLFKAFALHDHEKVMTLVRQGAPVDGKNQNGDTLLLLSAINGSVDLCNFLLSNGAQTDLRDSFKRTALMNAAGHGQRGVCEALLNAGTGLNCADAHGKTALYMAAQLDNVANVDIASLLLARGAQVDSAGKWGVTPLMLAAKLKMMPEAMVTLLLDHGADIERQDKDGQTALHHGAGKGRLGACQILLARGADANARAKHGVTPLIQAVLNGRQNACRVLLASGAHIDLAHYNHYTPLMLAAEAGNTAMCRLLVDHGASLVVTDSLWQTAFTLAGSSNKRDACELLLLHGDGPQASEVEALLGHQNLDDGLRQTLGAWLASFHARAAVKELVLTTSCRPGRKP